MVKSTSLPKGTVVIKPRRGGGAGILLVLILLLLGAMMLAGLAFFAPTRLALLQEQTLGLVYGGITDVAEETFVDGCVQTAGAEVPHAVTRTRRIVSFGNGTSLEVTYSGRPTPTNAGCP